ncbi:hypothetical protein LQZ18_19545 [Lachnospiraceae bacterium ZAX-1]
MQKAKKQALSGLTTALIIVTLLTSFSPVWYGLFASIPIRIAAITVFQVAIAIVAIICHCVIEKQPVQSLGFFKQKPLLQIGWAFAVFGVLLVVFIVLPVLLGQTLEPKFPKSFIGA